MAQGSVAAKNQAGILHVHYGVVEHLLSVYDRTYLKPVEFPFLIASRCVGVDVARELYLHGAPELILACGQHERHYVGQREDIVAQHIRESHDLASGPEVSVTYKPVVGIERRDHVFQRACGEGFGHTEPADIETVVYGEVFRVLGLVGQCVKLGLGVTQR